MITFQKKKVAIWCYTASTETVVLRPPSSHGDCPRCARASVVHASALVICKDCTPKKKDDHLVMTNIAMEHGPFIDDFPIDTSIYKKISMAMLNNTEI